MQSTGNSKSCRCFFYRAKVLFLDVFVPALIIGFVFNAAPGVITAQTISIGLRSGFWPSMQLQLGSLIGDAVWAILGLIGIVWIMSIDILIVPMLLAGGVFMIWLGWQTYNDALDIESLKTATGGNDKRAFLQGGFLSLSNPMNVSYWLGIGTIVPSMTSNASNEAYALFFAGFMLSSIVWCFVMSGIAVVIAAHATMFVLRWLFIGCAFVVECFGMRSIYNAFSMM